MLVTWRKEENSLILFGCEWSTQREMLVLLSASNNRVTDVMPYVCALTSTAPRSQKCTRGVCVHSAGIIASNNYGHQGSLIFYSPVCLSGWRAASVFMAKSSRQVGPQILDLCQVIIIVQTHPDLAVRRWEQRGGGRKEQRGDNDWFWKRFDLMRKLIVTQMIWQ